MAREFGQDPYQLASRWSQRQLKAALAWMLRDWNRPDRSDHYLMAVACEVRRVLSKRPGTISPNDFLLTFGPPKKQQPAVRHDSKSHWLSMMTMPVKHEEMKA